MGAGRILGAVEAETYRIHARKICLPNDFKGVWSNGRISRKIGRESSAWKRYNPRGSRTVKAGSVGASIAEVGSAYRIASREVTSGDLPA